MDEWTQVASAAGIPGAVVAVEQISRAWSNRLFRVETTAGEFAVKELLNPWSDAHWREWIVEASRAEQAAIAAGVSAPAMVLNPEGDVITDVGGRSLRVHDWIAGATPCPDAPCPAEIGTVIGGDLARTHLLAVEPQRTDVFPVIQPTTARGWPALIDELTSVDRAWAERAAAASESVEQVLVWFNEWLAEDRPTVMSHGDVDPKNVVLDAGGQPWLVDWDVAAPWRPMDELARTALSFSGRERPDLARGVVEAYAAAGGVVEEFSHLNMVVDLVAGLDWTRRCLRRATGLEECDDQRRAEATEMAGEELDALPESVAIARDLGAWLSAAD